MGYDKPLDCKNRNSSNYVTKYEHKALENNIQLIILILLKNSNKILIS